MTLSLRTRPLWAALFAVLLAAGHTPLRANVVSGAANAARIPAGGFAAAGPAWAGALNTHLHSKMFSAGDADIQLTVLPSVMRVDLGIPANHAQVTPIVHYITEGWGYDLKTFEGLPAKEKRDVLLLAAEEASATIQWDASLAMTAAGDALYQPANPGDFSGLESASNHLREFRTRYAMYLDPKQLEEIRKLHDQTDARVRELRRIKTLGAGEDIAGRLKDGEAALTAAEIGYAVTSDFEGDTAGWKEQDWERLERELDKVRAIVASGEPLRGAMGNIKFLSGPLTGLGEIKFGTNRTHRVFFRYHRKTRKVVFLGVLARETMNKNSGYTDNLRPYREDAFLESAMKEPGADMPLLKKITAADLDIRLNPKK